MTSQGYDFGRFRRALGSRNVTEALSDASALPHGGLVEALELVLLLCDQEVQPCWQSAGMVATAGRRERD